MVVAAIYVWVAVDLWRLGKHGLAMAFFMYALANVGFVWDVRGRMWET